MAGFPRRIRIPAPQDMADKEVLFWRWRVRGTTRTGRTSWRTLRWTMREEEAALWALANGYLIGDSMVKASGPPETRILGDEPTVGWGAFVARSRRSRRAATSRA